MDMDMDSEHVRAGLTRHAVRMSDTDSNLMSRI
jgi:hypothetical protein